jgi:hypothetical protein
MNTTFDQSISLAEAAESTSRPSDDDPMALVNYVQSRSKLSNGHHVDEEPLNEVPKVDGIELPEKDELAEMLLERVLAVPLPPAPIPATGVVREVKSESALESMGTRFSSSPILQPIPEMNGLIPLPTPPTTATATITDLPTADILPLPTSMTDSVPPSALMAQSSNNHVIQERSSSLHNESHPDLEEAEVRPSNDRTQASTNEHLSSPVQPRIDTHNIYYQAPFLPLPMAPSSPPPSLLSLPISNLANTPLGKGSPRR